MLISLNWLREYVSFDVAPQKLADDLTMAGLNVEGVQHRPNPFDQLRIGRVLSAEKHPEADRLTVCVVDIGEEKPRDIVCGAPNVRAGLEVAVIPSGSALPDGTLIKKGKLRGARSEGMICSSRELGLGDDHDGILELSFGEKPGTLLSAHYGAEDWVLNIEVTPNRPDQLGYFGVAREIAAIYGGDLRIPDAAIPEDSLADMEPVSVEIRDAAGCLRYIARRLEGARVGESPAWLKARIESMGLRPINNVVDVTNFVMFETGQPLHAFDAAKLTGGIVVRRAQASEKVFTLEEREAELEAGDLVIADSSQAVAIAGIMGLSNSKIDVGSSALVLESAYFDPRSIRSTRSRLDLSTDSSYRFERGGDFDMVEYASRRAAGLLAQLTGAKVATAADDRRAGEPARTSITLRRAKVNGLLGTDMSRDEIAAILERLQLAAEPLGAEDLRLTPPYFRRDLQIEVDLIEEVARIYGYNEIPSENRVRNTLHARLSAAEKGEARLHACLVGLGMQEVITSSFMDEAFLDRMGLPEDDARRRVVTVRNPLVSFNAKMRSSLLPGLIEVLRTNFHRGQEELRLYHAGRVYIGKQGQQLPDEPVQLALLITGHESPAHWSRQSAAAQLADLKGIAETIGRDLRVDFEFDYETESTFLVPGASFALSLDGGRAGVGGLLRPSLLRDLKQKRDVFYLEIEAPLAGGNRQPTFAPIPAYPASRRDLALIVPRSLRWAAVRETIMASGGKWLEDLQLFDIYTGEGISSDSMSCAVRLSFRSANATLTDTQVDKQVRRILDQLKDSLQVSLRS